MTEEHSISLQPGTVIGGKYEVVKCLGSGSMGLVYACRNRVLGQIVAVKVLFPEVATDKVASARFKNEILASYEVSHPNVVRAYEYITERDLVAYTMEYVGGGDLASKLGADERLPIPEILKLLSQMAAGCQAIHDAGIVHRDLKPENILLTSEGNVKIADFGIARNRHGPKLTEHGGVVGTIDYVAPEYMLKSQVDWRSDIYALGILAYEMVAGESPFKGDSVYATITKRLKTDPDPPSKLRSECPAELDRIILKAMQREPENRYQAGIEMFADLQKLATQFGAPSVGDTGALLLSGQNTAVVPRKGPTVEVVLDVPLASPQPPSRQTSSGRLGEVHNARGAEANVGRSATSSVAEWSASDGSGATQEPATDDILLDEGVRQRKRSGTEVLEAELVSYEVDSSLNADPYGAPEPLVSTHPKRTMPERVPSSKKGSAFRPSKGNRHSTSLRRTNEREPFVGEIIALCFATAVGIGCGFMFLKFFAPSLLAKWHF